MPPEANAPPEGRYYNVPAPAVPREEYYAEAAAITNELVAQTDRGAAIVGVALLDEKLRQVLEFAFDASLSASVRAELFEGPTAPLGSYSAKTRVARALGLFGDDFFEDLRLFGRIRNRFAHDLSVREFSQPVIAELCSQLKGGQVRRVAPDGSHAPIAPYNSPSDARKVFLVSIQVAVHVLFVMMTLRNEQRVQHRATQGDEL